MIRPLLSLHTLVSSCPRWGPRVAELGRWQPDLIPNTPTRGNASSVTASKYISPISPLYSIDRPHRRNERGEGFSSVLESGDTAAVDPHKYSPVCGCQYSQAAPHSLACTPWFMWTLQLQFQQIWLWCVCVSEQGAVSQGGGSRGAVSST